ncbi:endonuclease/exonuclease/phosphatase family protein [Aestuariivivens sediminis]|uniref:endonuclease/exonuclease/phosphatase family protein n=1 Tax=Aestuariivivens sediminis TaxID=2913557 RepID=UPI001F571A71|nr:endonuclease/exonuclease/phosphatase family protein [Aestuariivivens sediminis]
MNKHYLVLVSVLIFNNMYLLGQGHAEAAHVIRVLSYNIYHGETVAADKPFDLDLLAKVIADTEPDLVALQEVDFKTTRAQNYDLVTELGQRTKMAPLFGRAMVFDGGEYGEGLLSKYSFISTKKHELPAREGKESRVALEACIVLKCGDTIRFVGTHLDHTTDDTDRINQANRLNEIFRASEVPTILAGDFNAQPDDHPMQILYKEWLPTFMEPAPTYPAIEPVVKIDYILCRPTNRWEVLEAKVIDEPIASDHRPVLRVLKLKL